MAADSASVPFYPPCEVRPWEPTPYIWGSSDFMTAPVSSLVSRAPPSGEPALGPLAPFRPPHSTATSSARPRNSPTVTSNAATDRGLLMFGDGYKDQSIIRDISCEGYTVLNGFSEKAYNIFLDFMTRVAKFEELVNIGGRFLSTYKLELELFRRPPLQMKTSVIKEIMEANNSGWMRSYIEAGCRHHHTDIDNINKLNMCQQGIHEHIAKVKALLDELGPLMENVLLLVNEEIETLSRNMDELQDDGLVDPLTSAEEEPEKVNQYHQNTSISEYATMMQAVYSMLEDDYAMQEKIVSSLDLATPSEALESYCFMWDLRPFVDDDIIRTAWRHVK